jgi:polyhydroxyalkanoate synthesis regulator phasin
MYYGVDDLIKGFFMHAGLGRPNAMTGPQMDYMLNAIRDGTAVVEIQREAAKYRREVKKLKYRVAQLEMKLKKYEW